MLGRAADCREAAATARALAQEFGWRRYAVEADAAEGALARCGGDAERAIGLLEPVAVALDEGGVEHTDVVPVLGDLAEAYLRRACSGRRRGDAGAPRSPGAQQWQHRRPLRPWRGCAARWTTVGDTHLVAARDLARYRRRPLLAARAELARGERLRAPRPLADAQPHLHAALQRFEAAGLRTRRRSGPPRPARVRSRRRRAALADARP